MKEKTRDKTLTERDKQIIALISKGFTDKEIANEFDLSYPRICSIVRDLMTKTGTVNRAHLVSWAYRTKVL